MFQESNLPDIRRLRRCKASEIDLHNLSEGMAQLAIYNRLSTAVAWKLDATGSLTCTIVTGYGKSRKDTTDVRQRAFDLLRKPKLQASLFTINKGLLRLVLSRKDMKRTVSFKRQKIKSIQKQCTAEPC